LSPGWLSGSSSFLPLAFGRRLLPGFNLSDTATFGVSRATLYRQLAAQHVGRDCVRVVYRSSKTKTDPDTNRRYGETGRSEKVQREADSNWWPIAPARRARVKGIVYVVDGTVTRIRGIEPDGTWEQDDRAWATPAPTSEAGSAST
jgi:hypothetical protein